MVRMSHGLARDLCKAAPVHDWNMLYLLPKQQDHSHTAMTMEERPGDSQPGVEHTAEGLEGIDVMSMLEAGTCSWKPGD